MDFDKGWKSLEAIGLVAAAYTLSSLIYLILDKITMDCPALGREYCHLL